MMKRSKPSFSSKDQRPFDGGYCNFLNNVPVVSMQDGLKEAAQVTCVPACLQRVLSRNNGQLSSFDKSFLTVDLANSSSLFVRCLDATRVQDVIDHIVSQMTAGQVSSSLKNIYTLQAVCKTSGEVHWLHRDVAINDWRRKFESKYNEDEWRYVMRIRFFPKSYSDLLKHDKVAFCYLFDQVRNDLKSRGLYDTFDKDIVIELSSIEIRMTLKDKIEKMSKKKISSSLLEEIGWKNFLPTSLLNDKDSKSLMKSIQKVLRNCVSTSDDDCVAKYFDVVLSVWRFDEETFDCQLDNGGPLVPVRMVVGPTIGVSYKNSQDSTLTANLTPLAEFDQIKSLSLINDVDSDNLKIMLLGGKTPLTFSSAAAQADHLASLVDGYCFHFSNGTQVVWSKTDKGVNVNSGESCERIKISDSRVSKETPDYAVLEDQDNSPPINKQSSEFKYIYNLSKGTDVDSSSTPDLLSDARSSVFNGGGFCPQQSGVARPMHEAVVVGPNRHCSPSASISNIATTSSSSSEAAKGSRPVPSVKNMDAAAAAGVDGKKLFIQGNSQQFQIDPFQEKLRRQKEQSKDDAEWLLREEANRISAEETRLPSAKNCDKSHGGGGDGITRKTISISAASVETRDIPQETQVDRTNDDLYRATTSLVQSIVDLNGHAQKGQTEHLVSSTKTVGNQLKSLLSIVKLEVSSLPTDAQLEIEMAQKTISSDLRRLIEATKMTLQAAGSDALQHIRTVQQSAHALAVDAKTLFDALDAARKKKRILRSSDRSSSSSSSSSSASCSASPLKLLSSASSSSFSSKRVSSVSSDQSAAISLQSKNVQVIHSHNNYLQGMPVRQTSSTKPL